MKGNNKHIQLSALCQYLMIPQVWFGLSTLTFKYLWSTSSCFGSFSCCSHEVFLMELDGVLCVQPVDRFSSDLYPLTSPTLVTLPRLPSGSPGHCRLSNHWGLTRNTAAKLLTLLTFEGKVTIYILDHVSVCIVSELSHEPL